MGEWLIKGLCSRVLQRIVARSLPLSQAAQNTKGFTSVIYTIASAPMPISGLHPCFHSFASLTLTFFVLSSRLISYELSVVALALQSGSHFSAFHILLGKEMNC